MCASKDSQPFSEMNLVQGSPPIPSPDPSAGDANPPTHSPAIETISLSRRFGSLTAVDALTIAVPTGAIFGLLGTNGAGKTTLIKMLTTLLSPTSGTAKVAGLDICDRPAAVRQHIGYVSQMLSADGELTGYENLLISSKLYGIPRSERKERIAQALDFMELGNAADQRVSHYSGGMIRRLEIAQSMLHRPQVLFLDEPTVGLDPLARHAVWQRIRDLRREFGTTILMTTHDMEEADQLCEIVAFMTLGRVVALGVPSSLKAELGPEATLDDVFIRYTGSSVAERGDYKDATRTRRTAHRLE
jgi:ABC-2 type transport system ATP-binding protein